MLRCWTCKDAQKLKFYYSDSRLHWRWCFGLFRCLGLYGGGLRYASMLVNSFPCQYHGHLMTASCACVLISLFYYF